MTSSTSSSRLLHILLVEDAPLLRKLAVRILEAAGHAVTTAKNGREAVEAAASQDFDVVLMDVEMPQLDGLEATKLIREHEHGSEHIPIIAVTSTDPDPCFEAGMDGYLRKPVQPDTLFDTIAQVLSRGTRPDRARAVKRVLLADDDPHIVEPLRCALQQRGYSVLVATDGKEAMQLTEKDHPDLIVLDLIMPYCNGLQVLEKLRHRDFSDLPVIMITATDDSRYRKLATRLGVNDYVRKPFSPDRLVERIDRLLAA